MSMAEIYEPLAPFAEHGGGDPGPADAETAALLWVRDQHEHAAGLAREAFDFAGRIVDGAQAGRFPGWSGEIREAGRRRADLRAQLAVLEGEAPSYAPPSLAEVARDSAPAILGAALRSGGIGFVLATALNRLGDIGRRRAQLGPLLMAVRRVSNWERVMQEARGPAAELAALEAEQRDLVAALGRMTPAMADACSAALEAAGGHEAAWVAVQEVYLLAAAKAAPAAELADALDDLDGQLRALGVGPDDAAPGRLATKVQGERRAVVKRIDDARDAGRLEAGRKAGALVDGVLRGDVASLVELTSVVSRNPDAFEGRLLAALQRVPLAAIGAADATLALGSLPY